MRISRSHSVLTAALLSVAAPHAAHANGLELLPGGTQSVARGGAVAARPENAMALEQNPAGMALLSGNQLLLNVDVPLQSMCVDPYGYYGWGVYQPGGSEFGDPIELDKPTNPTIGRTYATSPLPQVCNTGRVVGIPHLAWVGKLTDKLAIGAGFEAPTLVTGLQFGGADGTVDTQYGARPTPTRYQLIRQEVKFALAPMVGAAYQLHRVLSLGVSVQVAMLRVGSRAVQNATSGTQPSTDWLADVDAHDYFVPTVTFSAHSKPIPALDLMASFRWASDFNGSGNVTYETNTYHDGATSGPIPFKNEPIKLSQVQVSFPWQLTVGARYAGLLPDVKAAQQPPVPLAAGTPPPAVSAKKPGLGDPMDRELWDVEVDASYNFNKRAGTNRVTAGEDVTLITREAGGGGDSQTQKVDDLSKLSVDRHLKDSIAVRAGGSFSVLPRKVAIDAGVFMETPGIDPAYASIDSFAFRRMGFGFGGMIRLGDFDLMAAYGHIFQETVEVAPPPHQTVDKSKEGDPTKGFDQRVGVNFDNNDPTEGVVLKDPAAPSPSSAAAVARGQQSSAVPSPSRPERVINAGKYTAAFNVISVGAVYHF